MVPVPGFEIIDIGIKRHYGLMSDCCEHFTVSTRELPTVAVSAASIYTC